MDQNTQIPEDIRKFLEGMLEEAGMLTLDDEKKEAMIQELFFQLDNFLANVIVKNLQPEDLETFIQLNEEQKAKEEIEQFVNQKLPNAQEIFSNAFLEFKRLYLDNVTTYREQNEEPPEKKDSE